MIKSQYQTLHYQSNYNLLYYFVKTLVFIRKDKKK
jgi:hypothetical protein